MLCQISDRIPLQFKHVQNASIADPPPQRVSVPQQVLLLVPPAEQVFFSVWAFRKCNKLMEKLIYRYKKVHQSIRFFLKKSEILINHCETYLETEMWPPPHPPKAHTSELGTGEVGT